MTIFVPEMLATSGTDGFLHSNLQNGAPRITPPTAPMLNCWIQSQKGSLLHIFPTSSFPNARVPAWPPLPGKQGSEQRRKRERERESRLEWKGPQASTGSQWSIIHKRQEPKNNGKVQISPTVIYMNNFHLPLQIQILKYLSKFHLLSKAGYLGHFC